MTDIELETRMRRLIRRSAADALLDTIEAFPVPGGLA